MFFNFYVPFTVCFFVCSATATQIFRLLCLGFVAFKQFVKSNGSTLPFLPSIRLFKQKSFPCDFNFHSTRPSAYTPCDKFFSLFLTRKLRCADNFAC